MVDLSALAEAACAGLEQGDPARRVMWRIEPGLVAMGDPRTLRVVIENLLGNAWKYTARKDPAAITFDAVEEGGGEALWTLSPECQGRFDPDPDAEAGLDGCPQSGSPEDRRECMTTYWILQRCVPPPRQPSPNRRHQVLTVTLKYGCKTFNKY